MLIALLIIIILLLLYVLYLKNRFVTLDNLNKEAWSCLLYTSPSPRDRTRSRMPSSA